MQFPFRDFVRDRKIFRLKAPHCSLSLFLLAFAACSFDFFKLYKTTAAKTRDWKSINDFTITLSTRTWLPWCIKARPRDGGKFRKRKHSTCRKRIQTKNFQKQSDHTLISDQPLWSTNKNKYDSDVFTLGFRRTKEKKRHAIIIVTYSSHSSIIYGSMSFTLNGSRISDN